MQHALIVAEIAQLDGNMELLDEVIVIISSLQGGTVDLFRDIASVMERAGRTEDRDRILSVLVRYDASLGAQFEALHNGLVNTLDESIKYVLDEAEPDTGNAERPREEAAGPGTGTERK